MVEIYILGWYANRMSAIAHEKGYRTGNYRLMSQLVWCVGELAGLFTGLLIVAPGDPLSLLIIYFCALAGAGMGAGIAYSIVRRMKSELLPAV